MRMRNLGSSGARVSTIGLGCSGFGARIDVEATGRVVDTALELGVTLFDTADVYGERYGHCCASESALGAVLGDRRRQVFLATKFGNPRMRYDSGVKGGGSRHVIMSAVEASLKRLNTDWIDLYQIHMPDPFTPIEETLRALDDLVTQGKVRYIGCSNFRAWQVVEAQWTSKHHGLNAFVSCENEYSLLVRDVEPELLPTMERYGMGLLPYYPLAVGLLTGKYSRETPPAAGASLARLAKRYVNDTNWTITERLKAFCVERGHTLLELAFSWLLAQSTVSSVIAGVTSTQQLKLNVAAVEWVLTHEELAQVESITSRAAVAN